MPDASNARRGRTGPKTAAGKAKVARNALRHGIAATVVGEPRPVAEVAAMARAIAGPRPAPEFWEAALAVAQAQVDLQRVHAVRRGVWDRLAQATSPQGTATPAPESLPSIFTQGIAELTALDRYERRARSRRKKAIRALDRARAVAPRHAGGE